MSVPTLAQLRDQLGRTMLQQPNSANLHKANRVLSAVFARQSELPSALKLGAARATALALDLARGHSLTAGVAMPLLSDSLDPARQPALAWARTHVGDAVYKATGKPVEIDPLSNLLSLLDRAQQSIRDAPGQAALDVANALDAAYQAVAESTASVAKGLQGAVESAARSAVLPVALTCGVLLAWGYANRRRTA